ncbi:hypothetical protein [Paenibacillus sp. V4I9]
MATIHKDLHIMIELGQFREDLYHCLKLCIYIC